MTKSMGFEKKNRKKIKGLMDPFGRRGGLQRWCCELPLPDIFFNIKTLL